MADRVGMYRWFRTRLNLTTVWILRPCSHSNAHIIKCHMCYQSFVNVCVRVWCIVNCVSSVFFFHCWLPQSSCLVSGLLCRAHFSISRREIKVCFSGTASVEQPVVLTPVNGAKTNTVPKTLVGPLVGWRQTTQSVWQRFCCSKVKTTGSNHVIRLKDII